MEKKTALPTKIFSSQPTIAISQPYLAEIQLVSWQWFKDKGLKELLQEISPIKDHSGEEMELHFLDYYFDEPKYTEDEAIFRAITYEAPLRAKVKLINRRSKQTQEQEVYLGEFPVMTQKGSFIVNGIERVVTCQLIRSPGVYFTTNIFKGQKFFGAKVIPDRGAWLEFETDSDGFIGVKIDRHRKTAVTALLRVFASMQNKKLTPEELLKIFQNGGKNSLRFLEATLKKDDAKNAPESYIEIYKRLRPGDLATPENAKSLIDAMFERPDRYGLSAVGRYKLNQRLGIKEKKEGKLLDFDDLILIIKEIIRLNNEPLAEPDDIDHLGNRRVRAVGELLQGRLYVGFIRLRRNIQDRMSTLEAKSLTPVQLINARPLTAVIKDFFATSSLSQFMDQVNALAELEHKRRLSALGPGGLTRERAGFEIRDVHSSYYGRICPIQTPEGQNIGLINYLASYVRLDELGFLQTPYLKVKNSKVTEEIFWFNALEEEKYKIAQGSTKLDNHGHIIEDLVEARIKGHPGTCSKEEVELIDAAPNQTVSVAASLIPFLEHDDANRALMGANMQRQAVPLIALQAPLVRTGIEERVVTDCGKILTAKSNGKVVSVNADRIIFEDGKGKKTIYPIKKFKRSNQYTSISQRPVVHNNQQIQKEQLLADCSSSDNGVLALGQNLLVAFLSWEGANFEDAIVLSERVARNDLLTSIHIEDFDCEVRDTKLGPEITSPDIPNVSEDKLKNLDEEGVIRIGAEVRAGDILVGKVSPRGETELTSEEKLLRAVFGEKAADIKDSSLVLPHGKFGRVISVKIFSRDRGDKLETGVIKKIKVEIAQLRKVMAGDKLAGRHGNKGVISQVRPIEDMPYLEDGTPVDIILNPLGVASRMNLGQILETCLGMAAHKLGYQAVVPPFIGATEKQIQDELKRAGFPETGKFALYDGRTGELFPRPVTVGYIYIMKLNHLVEDKIHMRSIGPYSLITQQPLGGKAQFGGQRFGEMEVWALEGYGAAHILQEMLTVKSDDILGRAATFESIIRNEKIKNPHVPSSFNVLINEMKALGLDVELINEERGQK